MQDAARALGGADTNGNSVLDDGEGKTTDIHAYYTGVMLSATNDFTFRPTGTSNSVATITLSHASKTNDIDVTIVGVIKMH